MGFMDLKKMILLFLVVSALLLSTSLAAGRESMSLNKLANEEAVFDEDGLEANNVHERVLRANTRDYGKYDPPPTLVKPPSKLIPN